MFDGLIIIACLFGIIICVILLILLIKFILDCVRQINDNEFASTPNIVEAQVPNVPSEERKQEDVSETAYKICLFCKRSYMFKQEICPNCGGSECDFKCSRCKTAFKTNNCPQCGLEAGILPIICPRCKTKNYSRYCKECGVSLYMQTFSGRK